MDSYFQNGVKLKGTLTVNGTVHFDGEIEGEILASDHLIIGEMGRVKGNIQTRNITNLGKIRGNITAENRVSLAQGSDLEGDILTGHLVVEEGCRFEGRCRMHQKAPAKTAAPVQSTLAEALPKIEEVPGEVASPPAEPEPVLEKPRKKKRWAGPVAAGVLLAAGVGGWYLYQIREVLMTAVDGFEPKEGASDPLWEAVTDSEAAASGKEGPSDGKVTTLYK